MRKPAKTVVKNSSPYAKPAKLVLSRLKKEFPKQPVEGGCMKFGEFRINVISAADGKFRAYGSVSKEAKNKFSVGNEMFHWEVRGGQDMFFPKDFASFEANVLVDVLIQLLKPMAFGNTPH